jgi:putative ABC transport system ATP-binding protein
VPEIEAVRRRYIGHALQSPELFPALSVIENIEIPLRLNRSADRAQRIEELLGALSNAQDPKEMIQRRHHSPHELSGGQRQRVALARAIAHRPLLLIADEPTSALDAATAKRAIKFLQSMRERDGTAILMATHDDSLAKDFADRILHMEVGQGNIATIVEEITLRTRPAETTRDVSRQVDDVVPLFPATN